MKSGFGERLPQVIDKGNTHSILRAPSFASRIVAGIKNTHWVELTMQEFISKFTLVP